MLLAFKNDIGQALADACINRCDEDAFCLACAEDIVRRDLFEQCEGFHGYFQIESEQKSISSLLLTLVPYI